jgi:hypothetical protein
MPAGPVHYRYYRNFGWPTVVILSLVVLEYGLLIDRINIGWYLEFLFWLYPHYLSGMIIGPDSDQIGITTSDGIILRKFGFLGVLIFTYWTLYAGLIRYFDKVFHMGGKFGGHQSKLSHSLVPGTLIRMVFIDFPFAATFWLFNKFAMRTISVSSADILVFLLAQFVALAISDGIHIWLDKKLWRITR